MVKTVKKPSEYLDKKPRLSWSLKFWRKIKKACQPKDVLVRRYSVIVWVMSVKEENTQ